MSRKFIYLGLAIAGLFASGLILEACGSGSSSPTEPASPAISNADSSGGDTDLAAFASVDIEKRTNGNDADFAPGPSIPLGSPVTWTYRITNNGNETLTEISAVDDRQGAIVCPSTSLAAGESMDCSEKTATVEVEGLYTNVATVSASDSSGNIVEDSDTSNYTGATGDTVIALDLEKQTNGEDADSGMGPIVLVGEPVTWTYIVTNNSNAEATDLTITDDPEGPICEQAKLAVGAQWTCEENSVAIAGPYDNEGTVIGRVADTPVEITDVSRYFGSIPKISMIKETDGELVATDLVPGCPVTWTYELTNTGNIVLENIVVTDSVEGEASCPSDTLPAESNSLECELTGTVGLTDYSNQASVEAQDPAGNRASATDSSSSYTVLNVPPVCDQAVASPAELWPPNHQLIEVNIANIVDACERPLTVTFDRVIQDEPINGTGDGDTSPDAIGVGTQSLQLRSERQGGGDGRVYKVDFTVTDPAEGDCTGTVTLMVPHDQSGDLAQDSGPPYYDSTRGTEVPE